MRNFIVATVLLMVAGGVFGYTYKIVGDKEETLKNQLAAIKIGNDREQTYYRLQKIAEESKTDREQLDRYFLPHVGESITFLTQVETLAPQNGITLKTDALEEGGDKKTKEKWVDAKFTFSGTRSDVERFISILENLPFVSRTTSVQLSARAANNWEAKVTIRVFITNHEK
jgi:hypothetical protein